MKNGENYTQISKNTTESDCNISNLGVLFFKKIDLERRGEKKGEKSKVEIVGRIRNVFLLSSDYLPSVPIQAVRQRMGPKGRTNEKKDTEVMDEW